MPVFYPSLVAHFKLRFDEAFHVSETPEPVSVTDLTTGKVSSNQTQSSQKATVRPLLLEGAKDSDTIVYNRIPKSADIELPGFRQAGTFKMTFDFRDLPIDPRLIRACGVDIHIGAVDPSDFSTGMTKVETDNSRRSVLRSSPENQVLAGIVDTWNIVHGEKGSEVSMEGRDLRGIFLDSPLDPKLVQKVDLSKPVDEVVQQILQLHPFGGKVKVVTQPDDWEGVDGTVAIGPLGPDGTKLPPVLPSPGTKDKLTRLRQDAAGTGKTRSNPSGSTNEINFWDLITRYCFLVGAVPYFSGTDLLIRPARSIYDQAKAGIDPRIKTPFKDGKQRSVSIGSPASKEQFSVRRLVYGRDVAQVTFERKYTGAKARVVECFSIDSSKGRGNQKVLIAQWPTNEALKQLSRTRTGINRQDILNKAFAKALTEVKKGKTTSVAPSGQSSAEEKLRIPVPGVSDLGRLLSIAKDIFEEIGRGEMGGAVQTKNLASFGGDNADPDNLRLRPGDGVELLVDTRPLSSQGPLVSALTDANRRSFNEQVQEVRTRLGAGPGVDGKSNNTSEDLARVIVASTRGGVIELQQFFRVSNIKYGWNMGAINISFDFQNYIEARSQMIPSTGASQSALDTITASPSGAPISGLGL